MEDAIVIKYFIYGAIIYRCSWKTLSTSSRFHHHFEASTASQCEIWTPNPSIVKWTRSASVLRCAILPEMEDKEYSRHRLTFSSIPTDGWTHSLVLCITARSRKHRNRNCAFQAKLSDYKLFKSMAFFRFSDDWHLSNHTFSPWISNFFAQNLKNVILFLNFQIS